MAENRAPVTYWQLTANGNDPLPTDTKYTSFELIEQAIAAVKRDLAVKVLAAVDDERLHENLDDEGDKGYMRAIRDVTAALTTLFAAEGINIEQPTAPTPEGE